MKAKILLLLTIVTFLSACESNNDPNIDITSSDLLGTWNLTKQVIEDGSTTFTFSGQTLSATYEAVATNLDFTYSFSEAPNKLDLLGSYTITTNVSFLGQNDEEVQEVNTDSLPINSVEWSLNGSSITFTENNELPTILNVEEFSTNFLRLKGEIDQTETIDGETISIKATMYIELER